MRVITIGAFGYSQRAFFSALQQAGVDTFCDIRWRRGVRGAEYAFVNSARLQKGLAELGIRYLHFRDLAPSPAVRRRQSQADQAAGVAKRKRSALSEVFISAYQEERLAAFDSHDFVERLGPQAQVVALFCVEREPAACHRSLLAARLQQDLGAQCEVLHLMASPGVNESAGG
jgi:uncharacterized protein (DUF488 family)